MERHSDMVLIQREGLAPGLLEQAQMAEDFLRESLEFYRRRSLEEQEGEGETPSKARDRLQEVRKLAVSALEEGRRVAEELGRARGIVHDYALDLLAARMEVERLLDRFAAEVRKRELSGQPD